MLNSRGMNKPQSERLQNFPSANSLLKISLGLILFTIFSSASVYAETISVDVNGDSFDVEYTTTGMTVTNIESDSELDFASLIITVDVSDSVGILEITFDRSFFDSVYDGVDDPFIILADGGEEPTSTETDTTTQSRTISIELPAGTEDVEIIGTDFGTSQSDTTAAADKAAADKAAADKAAADKAAADKAAADKAAADKAAADKAAADKAAADKAAADKAAADKAAADNTSADKCGEGTVLQDGVCVLASSVSPSDNTSADKCGEGTVLQDGACVLDERCGEGTVMKDGVCVLASTPASSETSVKGLGKDLVVGVIAAFVIAGIVGIVLAIMSKASKSKD